MGRLHEISFLGITAFQWLGMLLAIVVAVVVGAVVASLLTGLLGRLTARTKVEWDDRLLAQVKGPVRAFLALFAFLALLTPLHLAHAARSSIGLAVRVIGIAMGAWLAARIIRFGADTIEHRAAAKAAAEDGGELQVRGVRTQVLVLRRVFQVVVVVIGVSLVLLQFDVVRNVGVSLLASAGIAGVVLGLAAQKSIAGLLAGIQLSITQPVRIGDTVVIENETGVVEEINLTYVVVRLGDNRRLIVPMTRFLEQPFQNWTKVSPEMLGSVSLYADYRLPMEEVRTALDRALAAAGKLWDGKSKGVVLADVTERTILLRATVSAADAAKLGDLRNVVREHLVAWLRDHEGGRYLPRSRVEGTEEEDAAASAIE